ncbi:DegT/DnrJ/EryC1/StrS family aminotransferase, partial [Okeania sp. SIO1H2]|uniref:DegT/DnrJ/EryC1/StrS family aminotransferase n=1 Tax=Okeania sp. SIO1H2 TaxID=2607775 RepID=UPI00141CB8C2|nr:hypothetical protein [Okeania sp. SIO1H2]
MSVFDCDAYSAGIFILQLHNLSGRAANIGLGLHFHPLHLQAYYQSKYGYRPEDLPHATKAGSEIVSLPLYPNLSES